MLVALHVSSSINVDISGAKKFMMTMRNKYNILGMLKTTAIEKAGVLK